MGEPWHDVSSAEHALFFFAFCGPGMQDAVQNYNCDVTRRD
jgi:hypothetical protein